MQGQAKDPQPKTGTRHADYNKVGVALDKKTINAETLVPENRVTTPPIKNVKHV